MAYFPAESAYSRNIDNYFRRGDLNFPRPFLLHNIGHGPPGLKLSNINIEELKGRIGRPGKNWPPFFMAKTNCRHGRRALRKKDKSKCVPIAEPQKKGRNWREMAFHS